MVEYKDRREMRQELAASGYSMEYLDEWQPKTTLYRHAAGMDMSGKVAFPVGSEVSNVPGSPDYVIRKAKIGMLPYPPNDACTCKWGVERGSAEPSNVYLNKHKCTADGCEYEPGDSVKNPANSLRTHIQYKHTA